MPVATVAPDAPTLPHLPMDPRFRQRRQMVRRAEGRRRLQVLGAVTVAIALVAGAIGVLHTPLWKVRHIRVTGWPVGGDARLEHVAGLGGVVPMVDVRAVGVALRLEALPVVGVVTVTRQWPSTVRIALTVRTPVALAVAGGRTEEVDRTGRVLGPAAGATRPLPLLEAALPATAVGGWLPGSGALGEELALAATLGPALQGKVSAIAVATDGLVATADGATAVFGDTSQLAAKVSGLAATLATGAIGAGATVDLRVPALPTVTG